MELLILREESIKAWSFSRLVQRIYVLSLRKNISSSVLELLNSR